MEGWDDFFPEFDKKASAPTDAPLASVPSLVVSPAPPSSASLETLSPRSAQIKPPPMSVSPLPSSSTPIKPPPPPLVLPENTVTPDAAPSCISPSSSSLPSLGLPSSSLVASSSSPGSATPSLPTNSELVSQRAECARLLHELGQRDEQVAQLRATLQALRERNDALQATLDRQAQQPVVDVTALQTKVDTLCVELLTQQTAINDAMALSLASDVSEARIDSKVNPPCCGVGVHFLLTPTPPESYLVQWFRSFAGSLFEKIEGATQPTYTPTADDIGAVLKGRVSSPDGGFSEAEAGPVTIKKEIAEKLVEFLRKGAFNLDVDGSSSLIVTKKNIKLKVGRKTDLLGELGPGLRVDLVQGDKFCVKSPHWNSEYTFVAPKELRDLYVLALRLLNSHLAENEHDNSMRWQIVQLNAAKLQGLSQDSQSLRAYMNGEFDKRWERIRKVLSGSSGMAAPAGLSHSPSPEKKETEHSRKHEEPRKPKEEDFRNHDERKLEEKDPREPKPEKKNPKEPKEPERDAELKAAPRELKYDAEGFLIVDETERGFTSYEPSKHNSDSDEEDKKPQFKLAIRPEGSLSPPRAIPTLTRPTTTLALPKKKKEDKKTLKRPQTLPVLPLAELAESGWAGAEAFPKMQVDAFHEVKFLVSETVNVKIREGSVELLDIRGELSLSRMGSELVQTAVPFGFKGPVKKIVANEPSVTGEGGSYSAKFTESQDFLCALKYIVDCDALNPRNTLPLFAKVVWDCKAGETIVEINYDVNPKYRDALSGIKFLFNVLPLASVSKCVLPKGLCKAQGLWNPKTQQLMWKLPPATDKGRLLFRLVSTTTIVPSQMDVFFTGDLDDSLAGVVVDVASSDSLQTRKMHSVKAGMYSVFPSSV